MRNHPFGLGMGERSTLSFQTAEGKKEKSCHECYMVHQIQYLPRITPREGEHFFFSLSTQNSSTGAHFSLRSIVSHFHGMENRCYYEQKPT